MVPSLHPASASAVAALEQDPFYRKISEAFARNEVRRRTALADYFDYSIRQGTRIGKVVHLDEARIGVAVWLLPPTLAEADAAGAPCYLETFGSRSMKFYERLGFVARETFAEPTAQASYTLMIRTSREAHPPWRST